MINLYYAPTPNGWKITIMLEECKLPYNIIPVNLGNIISLRHVMTPNLSFAFRPDFSMKDYGGNGYFQKLDNSMQ